MPKKVRPPAPLPITDRRKHATAEFHRRRYLLGEVLIFIGGLPAEEFGEENLHGFLGAVLPGDLRRLFRSGTFQETPQFTPQSLAKEINDWLESLSYPELRKILEECGWTLSQNSVSVDNAARAAFTQNHKLHFIGAWEEARGIDVDEEYGR